MASNYLQFVRRVVPTVLRTEPGRRLVGTFAMFANMVAEAGTQAVRASWIGDSKGPAHDALRPAGNELSLPRYPVESWSQYHSRLQRAWEDWQHAGHDSSLTGQLETAGFPGAQIYSALSFGWPTRPPLNWPNDVLPQAFWWSKFWVCFPAGTHSVTAPGPIAGDGHAAGDPELTAGPVGIAPVQADTIRSIVRKFKPGHWRGMQVVFEIIGPTAGTGHVAGEAGLVAGGQTAVMGI